MANATEFKSARHLAAFLGLTPKQWSTGARQRLGRISNQGDVDVRRLLILGGTSLVLDQQTADALIGDIGAGQGSSMPPRPAGAGSMTNPSGTSNLGGNTQPKQNKPN